MYGDFLITLLGSGILTVTGILTISGLVLKYRTGTSNELICAVLLIISLIIWSVIGWIETAFTGADATLYHILFDRGFCYGGFSWFLAISGWDLGHGLFRYFRNRKNGSKG